MTKTVAEFAKELEQIRTRFENLGTSDLGFKTNSLFLDFFTDAWIQKANIYYNFCFIPFSDEWLDEIEKEITKTSDWSETLGEIDRLNIPAYKTYSEKQVTDLVLEAIKINRDFNILVKDNPLVTMSALTFEAVVKIYSKYYESSSCW